MSVHTETVGRGTAGTRFVDRIEELDHLVTALDDAAAGQPSLVLLGGDAGVGKTRLLAEFTGSIDGWVLRGGCLPLGERGLPFAPVVEVLRGLIADGRISEVPPALQMLVSGEPVGMPERPSGQAHLFLAFLQLLEELSANITVALILEDVHWADRSTRELLSFVAHNLRDQRLLVVASYRADDLDREHPLRLTIAELHRDPRVRRIELAAFSASHVADYLEAITGSRPSLALVAEIVERTDGNAFFIEELVAADGLNGRELRRIPCAISSSQGPRDSAPRRRNCCGSHRRPGAASTTDCSRPSRRRLRTRSSHRRARPSPSSCSCQKASGTDSATPYCARRCMRTSSPGSELPFTRRTPGRSRRRRNLVPAVRRPLRQSSRTTGGRRAIRPAP